MHPTFKDQCDRCHTWAVCHGYKGEVLCEECIAKLEEENKNENQSKETERKSRNSDEGVSESSGV